MRISAFSIPLLIALAVPAYPRSQGGIPTVSSIEPGVGKVGDMLMIQATDLDRANVAGLYLTDGNTEIKVAIVGQTATSITLKVTLGETAKLIEEPVKVTIEPVTTG